jgi:hypothetical protein
LPAPYGSLPEGHRAQGRDVSPTQGHAFGSWQNAANCEQNARAPHQLALSTINSEGFRKSTF